MRSRVGLPTLCGDFSPAAASFSLQHTRLFRYADGENDCLVIINNQQLPFTLHLHKSEQNKKREEKKIHFRSFTVKMTASQGSSFFINLSLSCFSLSDFQSKEFHPYLEVHSVFNPLWNRQPLDEGKMCFLYFWLIGCIAFLFSCFSVNPKQF